MTREAFEALAADSSAGVPVIIEDRSMGLCTHWDDEWVQIEAYKGNDHECIQVPWGNLMETPLGIIAGLNGAIRNADQ